MKRAGSVLFTVVVSLVVAGVVLGIGAEVAHRELAASGLRRDRVQAREAAEYAAADALVGAWIAGAGAVPIGGSLPLPPALVRPDLVGRAAVRRVDLRLWLVVASGTRLDRAGSVLASARVSRLVRLLTLPGDTLPSLVPTRRSWLGDPA